MSMSEHPGDMRIERSDKRVKVEVDGVTVAETAAPWVLFESGLPPRYYVPKEDVRFELLEPSETSTHCPLKGDATYWSVRTGEDVRRDLVWAYPEPIPEAKELADSVAFYDEKVDVYIDGVLQERPTTKFS